jgi:hypothetical protein
MSVIENKFAAEWVAVKEYCEAQIEELHEINEGDQGDTETAHIRGQIAMARKIMALADEEAPVELVRSNNYIE